MPPSKRCLHNVHRHDIISSIVIYGGDTVELDNNNHSVFLMYYHLVLVIKYRRKVIDDKISNRLKEIFEYITPELQYCIAGMESRQRPRSYFVQGTTEQRIVEVHQRL